MIAIGNTIGRRVVEGMLLESLVEGPVELEILLAAAEDAVVVGSNLGVGNGSVPEAYFVDIALIEQLGVAIHILIITT